MARCKFCGNEIFWTKEGRKNVPTNMDGGIHSCDEMKKSRESLKKFDRNNLSAEEIAKYEQAMNESANKKSK